MPVKNQALTAVCYYCTDADGPVTGDVGNHTVYIIGDGTLGGIAASPAEVDATNAPGVYKVAISAAENNYDIATLVGKSSTASTFIAPVTWTNICDVHAVSGDSTSATNMESFFDGTGYGIQAASALTTVSLALDGINTSTIQAGAINADAFATGAIDADAIAADAITSAKIADGAIGADQIATDAITSAKVATDAIGADQLADGAITDVKIPATVNASVVQVNASTSGVSAFSEQLGTVVRGEVAASGSSSTLIASDTAALSSTESAYKGRILTFVTGALAEEAKTITSYSASKVFTCDAFTGTPANNDTFIVS